MNKMVKIKILFQKNYQIKYYIKIMILNILVRIVLDLVVLFLKIGIKKFKINVQDQSKNKIKVIFNFKTVLKILMKIK